MIFPVFPADAKCQADWPTRARPARALLERATHELRRTANHGTASRQPSICMTVGADGFAITVEALGPTARKPRHESPRRTRAHDLKSCVARQGLICGRHSAKHALKPGHAGQLPRKAAAQGSADDAPEGLPLANMSRLGASKRACWKIHHRTSATVQGVPAINCTVHCPPDRTHTAFPAHSYSPSYLARAI